MFGKLLPVLGPTQTPDFMHAALAEVHGPAPLGPDWHVASRSEHELVHVWANAHPVKPTPTIMAKAIERIM